VAPVALVVLVLVLVQVQAQPGELALVELRVELPELGRHTRP
jgi:hypothetical protein